VRRSSFLVAGLAALFVAGLLAGCGAFPSVGWSPYPGTDAGTGWTPSGPAATGETVDPSVATLTFTFEGGAP
jgi:hypothetical protein